MKNHRAVKCGMSDPSRSMFPSHTPLLPAVVTRPLVTIKRALGAQENVSYTRPCTPDVAG